MLSYSAAITTEISSADNAGCVMLHGVKSAADECVSVVKTLQHKELESLETKIKHEVKEVYRDLEDTVYAAGSYILQAVEFYKYGKQFALATKTADLKGENYQPVADMLTQLLTSLDRVETLYQAFVKVEQKVYANRGRACKRIIEEANRKKKTAHGFAILCTLGMGVGAVALTAVSAGAALPLVVAGVAAGATGVAGGAGIAGLGVLHNKYATIESVFKFLEKKVVERLEKALTVVRKELAILHAQVQSVSDSVDDMKHKNRSDERIVSTFETFCERFAEIKESDLDGVRDTVESSKHELQKAADNLFN